MFPEGKHVVSRPYAPDCVNLRLATFSVFPSGHVPGTHVDIQQVLTFQTVKFL